MRIERQNAILQLINDCQIETQHELTEELKRRGFLVTQATVSRDIKELRLVKKQTDSGKSIYTKNYNKIHKKNHIYIYGHKISLTDMIILYI